MNVNEINKRAKEVEKLLCEMRENWIRMYDKLTEIIDNTEPEQKLPSDYFEDLKHDND